MARSAAPSRTPLLGRFEPLARGSRAGHGLDRPRMASPGGQPTFPIRRNSDADSSKTAVDRTLETAPGRRVARRIIPVQACSRLGDRIGPFGAMVSGSHRTRRWRKADSNHRSRPAIATEWRHLRARCLPDAKGTPVPIRPGAPKRCRGRYYRNRCTRSDLPLAAPKRTSVAEPPAPSTGDSPSVLAMRGHSPCAWRRAFSCAAHRAHQRRPYHRCCANRVGTKDVPTINPALRRGSNKGQGRVRRLNALVPEKPAPGLIETRIVRLL
jgi:hypothetical protein